MTARGTCCAYISVRNRCGYQNFQWTSLAEFLSPKQKDIIIWLQCIMKRVCQAACRDLKAQNIFMSAGGLLKLGDFGVSKVLSSTHHFAATAIGTPFYMSPEICQNKKYDAKVSASITSIKSGQPLQPSAAQLPAKLKAR